MSFYAAAKLLHVGCAVLSYVLFVLRGWWMLRSPKRLDARWVRIVPHVIDSALLAAAIALVVLTGQYPGPEAWLNAKIAALLLYIALGAIAIRHGRSRAVRLRAWIAAQAVFAYIVLAAMTRSSLPFAGH